MAKRLFDLIAAGLGLALLALPGLLVALAIKLDSPGPVFFRQERVGRGGRPFRIHKFRTMRVDAERHGQLTVGADARITRVGAFLRAHRLDELPQLLDVVQGTMSLVGPRPEVPRYVAHYPVALKDVVLSVRPGITDPASLRFRNESAQLAAAADPEREYIDVILPAKLACAADYAAHASLWTDLGVVLRSLRVLLTR
ncbi:sugar transferase [Ideonella sp. B7]|uniref:sugar transferase n=1 Tax=Ideonella benzenivorans TaxID=2831643 RepID=UPI001CECB916|nr:sugar transferase [Ideonella benzenivorans]MCA6216852.1 sugar transferase [Ideonella benzenivorans]